jgi:serine/threonine protein kinase
VTNAGLDEAAVKDIVANGDRIDGPGNQGSIHVGTVGTRRVLVKAAYGNPLMGFVRRMMLRRELRAYQRLDGVAGVPHCYGLFGGRYLAVEFIDARTFRQNPPTPGGPFFDRLFEIIATIHELGVAHGDLMRKSNILVAEDEIPYLIDFGVATIYRPGFHPCNHFAHSFLWQHDYNAWLKHKYQRRFEDMTPEDAKFYRPQLIDRVASAVKQASRKIFGRR